MAGGLEHTRTISQQLTTNDKPQVTMSNNASPLISNPCVEGNDGVAPHHQLRRRTNTAQGKSTVPLLCTTVPVGDSNCKLPTSTAQFLICRGQRGAHRVRNLYRTLTPFLSQLPVRNIAV